MINTPKPYRRCEDSIFFLGGIIKWSNGSTWTSNGDEVIGNSRKINTIYWHGLQDTATGNVILTITTDKEGVCPQSSDNVTLVIEPFPQFILPPHFVNCSPSSIDFKSHVSKPKNASSLRYNWYFGNGDSLMNSKDGSPKNIHYPVAKQGWYDVSLEVVNRWGTGAKDFCSHRVDSVDYVRVLPQPRAAFISNPDFYTTVDDPVFTFTDKTTIPWGKTNCFWNFDLYGITNDTSSASNPKKTYPADTGTFFVDLYSEYRYSKSGDPFITDDIICGDSIMKLVRIGLALPGSMMLYTLSQNRDIQLGVPFNGQLCAIDAIGRLMDKRDVLSVQREEYDISNWPPGVYFFVLRNGSQKVSRKIIKY